MPLKYRVLTIVGLCLVSVWFLFPRNVTQRERGRERPAPRRDPPPGPAAAGSRPQGRHVSRARDQRLASRRFPHDKKEEAIDRALKVVRTRIEGFGVSEVAVQKQGSDRIVVQIPGIQDPERARKLVEDQAFLEFKITDKSQALERALPRLDQVIKARGLAAESGDTTAKTRVDRRQGTRRVCSRTPTPRRKPTRRRRARRRPLRRRTRRRPTRSRSSPAARCRRSSSRARCRASSTSTTDKVPDAHELSRRLRGAVPRCRRARISWPAPIRRRCRASPTASYYLVDSQADHHRRASHQGAARTRVRPRARSSSSS